MLLLSKDKISHKSHPNRYSRASGVSLVEVLLTLTFLASTVLPLFIMLTQTGQSLRASMIYSTRDLLANRLTDEMDPARPDYVSQFSSNAMQTTVSDLGQTIPYIRQTDTITADASTALQRTTSFYIYSSTSDATSSPFFKTTQVSWTDELFIDCGGNTKTPVVDSSLRQWSQDLTYSSGNKQPGNSGTTATGTSAVDIVNISGNDDLIYQTYRQGVSGGAIDYNFDVTNGPYVVKLYFAETTATVTDTSPNRRRMDIYIEGTNVSTAIQTPSGAVAYYSPYLVTGGVKRANVQLFNVTVSDSVLNVELRKNANSDLDAQIAGISIAKRTLQ